MGFILTIRRFHTTWFFMSFKLEKKNGEKKLNILKIMWFVVSLILKQIKIRCLWDGGIWKIGSESQTPASLVAANIITNSKIIVNSVKIVSYNDITLNIRTLKSSQLFAKSYCFQMQCRKLNHNQFSAAVIQ